MLFNFCNRKNRALAKDLELRAIIMEEISSKNRQLWKEDDLVLDKVVEKKMYFEDHYATEYLTKLRSLSDDELKQFAFHGLLHAISYVRQLGAVILKGDIIISQRVLGVTVHDISDSVHNLLPLATEVECLNRSLLEYELLLILQFIHAYDDYQNIQIDELCIPFIQFKNSFPPNFLINEISTN